MARTDSRCQDCGHSAKAHVRLKVMGVFEYCCSFNWAWDAENGWYDGTGEGCPCNAYVQRQKNPARVKLGRNNKRRGYSAEALVAKLTGGERDRTSFRDVVCRGADGIAYASFEVKKRDAKVLHAFMRQSQAAAGLMPERPAAYVVIVPHGKTGVDDILVIETMRTWIESHGVGASRKEMEG